MIKLENTLGFFIIIINPNHTCFFIFFDANVNQITKSEFYKGRSFYKNFNVFVGETIESEMMNINKGVMLYIPKNYINNSIASRCETLGIELIRYLEHDKNRPELLSNIKLFFKSFNLRKANIEKFELLVSKLNTSINSTSSDDKSYIDLKKTKDVGKHPSYKGFSQDPLNPKIFKRSYSKGVQISKNQYEEINKWKTYKSEISALKIDEPINNLIEKFWDEVVIKSLEKNSKLKVSLQLRVQFSNLEIRSLSYLDTVGLSDFDLVSKSFTYCYSEALDVYKLPDFQNLIVVYKICSENYKRNISTKTFETARKKSGYTHSIMGYNIPSIMDFKKWGPSSLNVNTNIWTVLISEKIIAEIDGKYNENKVYIIRKGLEGKKILLSFIDKVRHSSFNKKTRKFELFERLFKNKSIIFKEGKEVLQTEEIDTKFIASIKKQDKPNNKIITMDLETRTLDDKLSPVCVSIYDGKKKSTFWVGDFTSPEAMLEKSIRSILIRKYRGYKIYLHNFSYFDGVFLLKVLSAMSDIKITPLIRDDRILKISIQFDLNKGKKGSSYKGSITIFDSLLLLPVSLEKLAKTFNCESKGMFPLKFLNNPDTPLNYVGVVPGMEYHYHPDPLTQEKGYNKFSEKYNDYSSTFKGKEWNLKNELVNYCEQDVISLHQVITKFSGEIYQKFKINISIYPTLPSIAFAIYRSIFMPKETIPILMGGIYNDIKEAFYGGFVDVYKVSGENVNGYDVNSLYPSSMRNCGVPVGKPIFFTGDPLIKFSKFFGFAFVEVQAPLNLKNPILPYKMTNKNGSTSTINAVGTWEGWYFSEEIKNAEKYGYKFKIIRGYQFQQKKIFTKYVQELYDIKCNVTPDNPWYTIAKLLLNSLFGRFGMDPEMFIAELMDDVDFDKLHEKGTFKIKDRVELGVKSLVIYEDTGKVANPNISIAVSAAISSFSRIHMTHFISKYSDSICYIDTDGIKTSSVIDKEEIGSELGKMKFEGSFKEAVFIAPKVYAGVSTDSVMTVKVKGLKEAISYWLMKQLLYLPKLEIAQERMVREWGKGYISLLKGLYTLSATENKRVLIRDSCGKIIDTRPYELKDGVKIVKSKFVLYYLPKLLESLQLPLPFIASMNLRLPSPKIFLSLPSNNIIYLPSPSSNIIFIYPSLPPVIYIQPTISVSLPTNIKRFKSGFTLQVVDLKTNKTTIYFSYREAERALNMGSGTITRRIKKNITKPYKNRYLISKIL